MSEFYSDYIIYNYYFFCLFYITIVYVMSGFPDSDSSVLGQCLDLVKSNNEEINAGVLRNALAAIAQEVQNFRSANISDEMTEDAERPKLRDNKRKQIRALKESLNTACTIAKTVISAKESECHALNNHLALAKNESACLVKKNVENIEIIQRLNLENHILSEKVQTLNNFIELGYKELQKIRNQPVDELPILMQLKEIMVCCGQYYADYCNEHEKCIQLEQKNRYLGNKLNILETNLSNTTEKLKSVQESHKTKTVARKNNGDVLKIGYVRSEYNIGPDVNVSRATLNSEGTTHKDKYNKKRSHNGPKINDSLDLSSHMSIVKNLLIDQDSMLNDLKKLTDELGIVNS